MADISTNMSVTGLSQFKNAFSQAQNSVKTLSAELKRNEAQYKATGDREKYLEERGKLLKAQLIAQQKAADSATKALEKMNKDGVSPTNKAYQDFYRKLAQAETAIAETTVQMNNLSAGEETAAKGADSLSTSLNGINKKVSLDAVISGIGSITGAMESAAKKAVKLGEAIWDNVMDSARWGDDAATTASILGMDVEEYQRYKNVFDTYADLTVADWQKAKLKLQNAIYKPSAEQTEILALLGIKTHDSTIGKYGEVQGAAREWEDVFWDFGETIQRKIESGELTPDLADTYAQAIFGKTFGNFNPIFGLGREDFEKALENTDVVAEENVNNLAALNDKVIETQQRFDALKNTFIGELAPALTTVADSVSNLFSQFNAYLQTEEGQAAMASLSESITTIFSDIASIDFNTALNTAKSALDGLIGGLTWLKDNWGSVKTGLEALAIGFAGLKVSQGVLTLLNASNGLKNLLNIGGAATGGGGATVAGGGGFLTGIGTTLAGLWQKIAPLAGELSATAFFGGNLVMDKTEFGQTLREGGTVNDALAASGKAIGDWFAQIGQNVSTFGQDWANVFGRINTDTKDIPFASTPEEMMAHFAQPETNKEAATTWWEQFQQDMEDLLYIPVTPETDENAAEEIAAQVGTVSVPVQLIPDYSFWRGGAGGSRFTTYSSHANGLPWVPYDGYPAILHRGERVLTAEANRTYNTSSNVYVENMHMANDLDVKSLADELAARTRRINAGYGGR